jgi:hypothetical protein
VSTAGVKATGFAQLDSTFKRAADMLGDEDAIRDICHEALRPVADQMFSRVKKRSKRTAEDIRIGDEPSGQGIIRASVGFSRGKSGRAFVAMYLEFGTVKRAAYPFIRPSYDATGGAKGMGARVAASVMKFLGPVLKR